MLSYSAWPSSKRTMPTSSISPAEMSRDFRRPSTGSRSCVDGLTADMAITEAHAHDRMTVSGRSCDREDAIVLLSSRLIPTRTGAGNAPRRTRKLPGSYLGIVLHAAGARGIPRRRRYAAHTARPRRRAARLLTPSTASSAPTRCRPRPPPKNLAWPKASSAITNPVLGKRSPTKHIGPNLQACGTNLNYPSTPR